MMSDLKCEKCGGTIKSNEDETVGICDCCGAELDLSDFDNENGTEDVITANEKSKTINKKAILIGGLAVVALIALFVLYNIVLFPASNYKKAVLAMSSGDYDEAYSRFAKRPDYKDSSAQIENCFKEFLGEEKYNYIKTAKVGDYITLGIYEQDNDLATEREEIEWRVLERVDNRILVISKYALDCQQYNTKNEAISWEKCSLREWLNDTFIKTAFSSVEQGMIKSTKVNAEANSEYNTNPGKDTKDKVFLLSFTEAEKYFSDDDDRMCAPTVYTIDRGTYTSQQHTKDGNPTCWWWLRSPGYSTSDAANIDYDGCIVSTGDGVDDSSGCVRPAFWIEI